MRYSDRGSGPPLVLVAGPDIDDDTCCRQLEALAAAGFRALVLGRDVGDSTPTPKDWLPNVHDLADFVERLDVQSTVLVGRGAGAETIVRYLAETQTPRVVQAVLVQLLLDDHALENYPGGPGADFAHDLRTDLRRVHLPVFVAHGREVEQVGPSLADHAEALLARPTLRVYAHPDQVLGGRRDHEFTSDLIDFIGEPAGGVSIS